MTAWVSVVTPAYNAAATLEDAYQSLLQQQDLDWEWLVIDNASADSTATTIAALARDDGRIRHLTQAKPGVSPTRNLGIREASGDYIAFLDADDVLGPDSLRRRAAVIDRHDDCEISYCDAHFVGPNLEPMDWVYGGKDVVTFADAFGNPCAVGSALMGTSALIKQFEFPEIDYGEDWLFLARILRTGATLRRAPESRVLYRQNPESAVQSDMLRHELSCLNVIDLVYGRDPAVTSAPAWEDGLEQPDIAVVKGRRLLRLLTHVLLHGLLEEANYALALWERHGMAAPSPSDIDTALEVAVARTTFTSRSDIHEIWFPYLAAIGRSASALRMESRFPAYWHRIVAGLGSGDPTGAFSPRPTSTGRRSTEQHVEVLSGFEQPGHVLVAGTDEVPLLLDLAAGGWTVSAFLPSDTARRTAYRGHLPPELTLDPRDPAAKPIDWSAWRAASGDAPDALWLGPDVGMDDVGGILRDEARPRMVILSGARNERDRSDASARLRELGYRVTNWRPALVVATRRQPRAAD